MRKSKYLEGPFFIIVNFLPIYFSYMLLYPLPLMSTLNKKLVKKLSLNHELTEALLIYSVRVIWLGSTKSWDAWPKQSTVHKTKHWVLSSAYSSKYNIFSFYWDWPRNWWRNGTIFLPKMGGGASLVGVSPPKRSFQSFSKWAQIKAEVMRKKWCIIPR